MNINDINDLNNLKFEIDLREGLDQEFSPSQATRDRIKSSLQGGKSQDAKQGLSDIIEMKTIKERLERYHLISFVKDETIEKGVFEIFTSGKQNKKEFKKNVVALRFLTNKGYQYRMLPVKITERQIE